MRLGFTFQSRRKRGRQLLPWLAVLFAAASVHAAGLPDSGQVLCDNGFNVLSTCDAASTGDDAMYPRQDGRFGADAQSASGQSRKVGAGAGGLDYTKIANNGAELEPGAGLGPFPADWGCTRDNATGLLWEIKNTTWGDLHDWGATFSWYSHDDASNGNGFGAGAPTLGSGAEIPINEGGNTCHFLGMLVAACNTEAFVAAVNNAGLCGYHDGWRLPTQRELLTLVNAGAGMLEPNIDNAYFPNTVPPILGGIYWSAATYLAPPHTLSHAWGVDFEDGNTNISPKDIDHLVRLVRGTPF